MITRSQRVAVMDIRLAPCAGDIAQDAPLPGGDFEVDEVSGMAKDLQADFPFLTEFWALRLIRAYGTQTRDILAGAETAADLGRDFGATLTEREVLEGVRFPDAIANGIKSGAVKWAIDQQPYLQGYLPVVLLATLGIAVLAAVLAFLPQDEPSAVVLVQQPEAPAPSPQPIVQPTPTVLEERA